MTKIHVVAFSSFGKGMSGGDNIYIELCRRWAAFGARVTIHVFEDGYEICKRAGLENVDYKVLRKGARVYSLPLLLIIRTFLGCLALAKEKPVKDDRVFVYSSSDFWPDVLPAFFFSKIRNKFTWIAGFFMFAPSPLARDFPYKGLNIIRGVLYSFLQRPAYALVRKFANLVFVTSEPDVAKFLTSSRPQEKIVVVKGGVDLDFIRSVSADTSSKTFDAVFMGRLHPQKGVFELLEIWRRVIALQPGLTLAIIGDGYLRREIEEKIKVLGLEKRITLFGYRFGADKFKIFKSSKVVLHPAIYDSGGMAACEAMACGLPGISFDLEALKTYYPKGMMKIKCFDLDMFAQGVIALLKDKMLYGRIAREAVELTEQEWDWNKRAKIIYDRIFS